MPGEGVPSFSFHSKRSFIENKIAYNLHSTCAVMIVRRRLLMLLLLAATSIIHHSNERKKVTVLDVSEE